MMRLITLSFFWAFAQSVLIPGPPGPYLVASKVQQLVDPNRLDPYAPAGSQDHRRTLISAYLPIDAAKYSCDTETVPYMPNRTANVYTQTFASLGLPAGFLTQFKLEFCDTSKLKAKKNTAGCEKEYPVVIFSPGRSATRLLYGAAARSLASHGYVVITVDHPYDALIVEFPDGTSIGGIANATDTESGAIKEIGVRAGDVSFIIDQLHNETMTNQLLEGIPGKLRLDKIAMYGHSLGGATAATAMLTDDRILGGLDIDGTVHEPARSEGEKRPFLLVGSQALAGNPILFWDAFWKSLTCAKMQIATQNTTHDSFTDGPLLATVADLPDAAKPVIEKEFGTLDAKTLDKTVNGILTAFADFVFKGKAEPLEKLGQSFDALSIDRSDLTKCS